MRTDTRRSPKPDVAADRPEGLDENRGLLVVACIFAVVGGYLDAYSFLAHGNVFANAQTGNVVLLAVHASGGEWTRAARHLPPIAAFALGVVAAKLIGARSQKRTLHATRLCQVVEIVILSGLAAGADRLPKPCVVPIISFVAALQNTSFSALGPWSFNSTMTTGNLRNAVSGLVLWGARRDPAQNRDKAVALGSICGSFLLGAFVGGVCTRWNASAALLPCITLVVAGSLLSWREGRRRVHGEAAPV